MKSRREHARVRHRDRAGRRARAGVCYGLEGLSDAQVAKAMFALRRQGSGQRLPAARAAARGRDLLRAAQPRRAARSGAWASRARPEAELVQRFFDGIEKYSPDLVSWNGTGFDLPVLHYRALLHGVQAPRYWETGDEDHGVPLQQLPQPLSLAAHRSHGRAVRLPGPRRAPRSPNMATLLGLARQARLSTAARCGTPTRPATSSASATTARPTCSTPSSSTCASRSCAAALSREQHAEEVARVKS